MIQTGHDRVRVGRCLLERLELICCFVQLLDIAEGAVANDIRDNVAVVLQTSLVERDVRSEVTGEGRWGSGLESACRRDEDGNADRKGLHHDGLKNQKNVFFLRQENSLDHS